MEITQQKWFLFKYLSFLVRLVENGGGINFVTTIFLTTSFILYMFRTLVSGLIFPVPRPHLPLALIFFYFDPSTRSCLFLFAFYYYYYYIFFPYFLLHQLSNSFGFWIC